MFSSRIVCVAECCCFCCCFRVSYLVFVFVCVVCCCFCCCFRVSYVAFVFVCVVCCCFCCCFSQAKLPHPPSPWLNRTSTCRYKHTTPTHILTDTRTSPRKTPHCPLCIVTLALSLVQSVYLRGHAPVLPSTHGPLTYRHLVPSYYLLFFHLTHTCFPVFFFITSHQHKLAHLHGTHCLPTTVHLRGSFIH